MAVTRADRSPRIDEQWAELADLILVISREIQFRGYQSDQAVPLSQSEGVVMRHLNENSEASPSRIAAATGLQRTNLSTVLRGLEQKGLIDRQADPADGRSVAVAATARGRDNYRVVRQEWAALMRKAAAAETNELRRTVSLLRAIEVDLVSTRPDIAAPRPGL